MKKHGKIRIVYWMMDLKGLKQVLLIQQALAYQRAIKI